MTYEFDWEETGEYCPQCGGAIRIRSCETCGGEGDIDLYEEDAINFSPGETEYCEDCSGRGFEQWCPNCGDISEETCPTCGGSGYVQHPECSRFETSYITCPDCDGDRIVMKITPFPTAAEADRSAPPAGDTRSQSAES